MVLPNQVELATLRKRKIAKENELKNYKKALSSANATLAYLKQSKSQLTNAQDKLKKYFTIYRKTPDNGKINVKKQEIDKIINELNNDIIPEINSDINKINIEIKDLTFKINSVMRNQNNISEY